ncbi:cupin [Uliginosibacterium sp. H1]|uniref:cupin n=1 Tax=Uliginosibacterium sp. H1 TaxID=3114757 RepID=UPI002E188491|nr:cupin [Uliginosibacterium sp. H1]
MAIPHAKSGDVVSIGAPLGAGQAIDDLQPGTLIRDEHMEVFRLVLQPGTRMQDHQASGVLTIQCLHGSVQMTAHGRTQTMVPGSLMHLRDGETHAVATDELSVLLLTLFLRRV